MKDKILKLRKEGKSYREIEKILGCSRSLVSYYCSKGQKQKNNKRSRDRRISLKKRCLEYKGGKCIKCGYNSCDDALEFHHRIPEHKDFEIGSKSFSYKWNILKKELNKCDLLCANCHREIHFEIRRAARTV